MILSYEQNHKILAYKNQFARLVKSLVELSEGIHGKVMVICPIDGLSNPEKWVGANWNWYMRVYNGWNDYWCKEFLK